MVTNSLRVESNLAVAAHERGVHHRLVEEQRPHARNVKVLRLVDSGYSDFRVEWKNPCCYAPFILMPPKAAFGRAVENRYQS